jgi:hypothetical protein
MRLPHWRGSVRLLAFTLLLLASCPWTAPFQSYDPATAPVTPFSETGAIVQTKAPADAPTVALVLCTNEAPRERAVALATTDCARAAVALGAGHVQLRI